MGFGRKGLPTGQAGAGFSAHDSTMPHHGVRPARRMPSASASAYSHDLSDEEVAARREAFLASERKNGTLPKVAPTETVSAIGAVPASRRPSAAPIQPPKFQPAPAVERAVAKSRADYSKGSKFFSWWGTPDKRNLIVAYVLWYFASIFGLHRVYCGDGKGALYQISLFVAGLIVSAIAPLLGVALLCCWFGWIFLDLFLMPGMMRRLKEAYKFADERTFA